jgi:hypothetical protein
VRAVTASPSLSPSLTTLGVTGGYLSLFHSSCSTKNGSAIVAVELDTMANPEFANTNDNHVGLDLGSMVFVVPADLASSGIDLRSGNLTMAWINHHSVDRYLEVFLSYAPPPGPSGPSTSRRT